MSQAEFPTDAEQNTVVRWLQIIVGTIVLLAVATIAYGVLLTIAGLIPDAVLYLFPFHSGVLLRVIITASIGMWIGAASLKLLFPRVSRGPVFGIVASLMLLAIVGGSLAMAIKGTREGWEGVVSAIVFLVTSASYIRGDDWQELPGRKSR